MHLFSEHFFNSNLHRITEGKGSTSSKKGSTPLTPKFGPPSGKTLLRPEESNYLFFFLLLYSNMFFC
jgi:hypothetical protein